MRRRVPELPLSLSDIESEEKVLVVGDVRVSVVDTVVSVAEKTVSVGERAKEDSMRSDPD